MENDIVSTTCSICSYPTFMCDCDSTWDYLFQNCIGKVDETKGVSYTSLNISTMTICFNFNQEVDLKLLYEKISKKMNINYNPMSKKSKVQKKRGADSFYNSFDIKLTIVDYTCEPNVFSNVSIFIFPNGKVKTAGTKTVNSIKILTTEIIELLRFTEGVCKEPATLDVENIKVQMICSDFKIKPIKPDPDGWCIKQENLKNILVKDYSLSATFSTLSRYPGINLKIPSIDNTSEQISLLIFRSGSIIITGAKKAKDVSHCYFFITNLICNYSAELFYYDINEDIKQKKKKKTN